MSLQHEIIHGHPTSRRWLNILDRHLAAGAVAAVRDPIAARICSITTTSG